MPHHHHTIPEPIVLEGLADATWLTVGLHDQIGSFVAAVPLSDDGTVLDLTLFDAGPADIDVALDWATCLVYEDPRATRLLLLSGSDDAVDVPNERDLAVFRLACSSFARAGVDVVDWVQTDGENIRSLAYTVGVGWAVP